MTVVITVQAFTVIYKFKRVFLEVSKNQSYEMFNRARYTREYFSYSVSIQLLTPCGLLFLL